MDSLASLKKSYLDSLEDEIIKCRSNGMSLRDIAKEVGISHQAVKRILVRTGKGKFKEMPNDIYAERVEKEYPKYFVYFIQDEFSGRIKIGTTKDVRDRLKRIQIFSPISSLKIIGCMEGSYKKENFLHRKFKKFRLHGEWFEPSEEIFNFLEQNKDCMVEVDLSLKIYKRCRTCGVLFDSKGTRKIYCSSKHYPSNRPHSSSHNRVDEI